MLCFQGGFGTSFELGEEEKKKTPKITLTLNTIKPGLKYNSEHDMHLEQAKVNVVSEDWPTDESQDHCFPSLLLFLLVYYGK